MRRRNDNETRGLSSHGLSKRLSIQAVGVEGYRPQVGSSLPQHWELPGVEGVFDDHDVTGLKQRCSN